MKSPLHLCLLATALLPQALTEKVDIDMGDSYSLNGFGDFATIWPTKESTAVMTTTVGESQQKKVSALRGNRNLGTGVAKAISTIGTYSKEGSQVIAAVEVGFTGLNDGEIGGQPSSQRWPTTVRVNPQLHEYRLLRDMLSKHRPTMVTVVKTKEWSVKPELRRLTFRFRYLSAGGTGQLTHTFSSDGKDFFSSYIRERTGTTVEWPVVRILHINFKGIVDWSDYSEPFDRSFKQLAVAHGARKVTFCKYQDNTYGVQWTVTHGHKGTESEQVFVRKLSASDMKSFYDALEGKGVFMPSGSNAGGRVDGLDIVRLLDQAEK